MLCHPYIISPWREQQSVRSRHGTQKVLGRIPTPLLRFSSFPSEVSPPAAVCLAVSSKVLESALLPSGERKVCTVVVVEEEGGSPPFPFSCLISFQSQSWSPFTRARLTQLAENLSRVKLET